MKKVVVIDRADLIDFAFYCMGRHGETLHVTVANWLGYLTDEEIAEYAASRAAQKGFCQDDGDEAVEELREFRDRFLTGRTVPPGPDLPGLIEEFVAERRIDTICAACTDMVHDAIQRLKGAP